MTMHDSIASVIQMLKDLGWKEDEIDAMTMNEAIGLLELNHDMESGDD